MPILMIIIALVAAALAGSPNLIAANQMQATDPKAGN